MKWNRKQGVKRLEIGLLTAVLVLFLYAPAESAPVREEQPELRFRTVEILHELADWLGWMAETGDR